MEEAMAGLRTCITLFVVLGVLSATATAASSSSPSTGSWRLLAAAPVSFPQGQAGVWTGRRLILIGRAPLTNPSRDVAATYDPATDHWTKLRPPAGPEYVPGFKAIWTGGTMIAFDPFHSVAYRPATNAWRVLPKAVNLGFVAWTGREVVGWGGGCCGDAQSDGSAYNPATGRYRVLPRAPLGPAQGALGAWTGHELILFIGRYGVDGKLRPTSVARGAAYDPRTNAWRRLAPLPVSDLVPYGVGAWDGHELLVAGAGQSGRSAYAYDPASDRWRRIRSLPAPRIGAVPVWTGTRLYLLGGDDRKGRPLVDGVAYDPVSDRWTSVPALPFENLYGATAVWTGSEVIVSNHGRTAAYRPASG
jgi:N-acetylneuraminic acid mutarotase